MEKFAIICSIIILVMLISAFAIPSIIIGIQWFDASCTANAIVHLPQFLIVNASILILILLISIAFIIQIWAFKCLIHPLVLVVINICFLLFTIAWNIVGSVAIFRDAYTCKDQAYPLWAMTLAILIFQWIGMFFSICGMFRLKETKEEK